MKTLFVLTLVVFALVPTRSFLLSLYRNCCTPLFFFRNGRVACPPIRGLRGCCGVLTYKCNSGYTLRGLPANTCSNKRWSMRHPSCEVENLCLGRRRVCDRNAICTPTFGSYTCQCKPGYTGDGRRNCEKTCGKPRVPLHGGITPDKDEYDYLERVTFFCEPGYKEYLGSKTALCRFGSFLSNPPVCLKSDCNPPPSITNGKMRPFRRLSWAAGHSVTYSCNDGYLLVGEEYSECQSSGSYTNNPPPICVVKCETPIAPANGRLVEGDTFDWKDGDVATIMCDEGYSIMGTSVATCTAGNWVPPLNATCTPIPTINTIVVEEGSG